MDASKAFADSTKFYFTLHKEKVGPYDLAKMKAEYKNGNLRPGTYVWYKALGRTWVKLQVYTGTFMDFDQPVMQKHVLSRVEVSFLLPR